MFRSAVVLLTLVLPWPLRRALLKLVLGYQLDRTSRMGFAFVAPRMLVLHPHASIGHLTVCKGVDLLELGDHATIGRANWITGSPSDNIAHYADETDRSPSLMLGRHAAITNRHLIDCTARVIIGDFTTFAGFRSQLLSHSIDLEQGRQRSAPVTIGKYCFVGTNCVVLGGSSLPDYSVLAAGSLLQRAFSDTHHLYGGVPAQTVKRLRSDLKYFSRTSGYVN